VEQLLEATVVNSQDPRLLSVEIYSRRPVRGAVPFGVNVSFHSGARICGYIVHTAAAGSARPGRRFPSAHEI
jgi:hypothetical protein